MFVLSKSSNCKLRVRDYRPFDRERTEGSSEHHKNKGSENPNDEKQKVTQSQFNRSHKVAKGCFLLIPSDIYSSILMTNKTHALYPGSNERPEPC
jgi:hypothetical protein